VADDNGLLLAERVEDPDHVADEVKERIFLDLLRTVGLPIAAHVGGDRAPARFGERAQLMPPGVPGFRKAVAHQDERRLSRLGEMDADAVCLDRPMCDPCHSSPSNHYTILV
jgi:hypothetical protein